MVSFTTVLLLLVATISSSAPPPSPPPSANWTTTKDLVSLLQRIESDSSNDVTPLTSRQLVTSLRKLSYDSSYWNSLIPEVASTPTKLEASSNVPSDAIQRLSRGNNNLVDSSTGKSLDVNHLWAAMDVIYPLTIFTYNPKVKVYFLPFCPLCARRICKYNKTYCTTIHFCIKTRDSILLVPKIFSSLFIDRTIPFWQRNFWIQSIITKNFFSVLQITHCYNDSTLCKTFFR